MQDSTTELVHMCCLIGVQVPVTPDELAVESSMITLTTRGGLPVSHSSGDGFGGISPALNRSFRAELFEGGDSLQTPNPFRGGFFGIFKPLKLELVKEMMQEIFIC